MPKQWPPHDEQLDIYANMASKFCAREKKDCVVYLSWAEPESVMFIPRDKFTFQEGLYCKRYNVRMKSDKETEFELIVAVTA